MKTLPSSSLFKTLAEVSKFNTILGHLASTPNAVGRIEPVQIMTELKIIEDVYSTPKKGEILSNFTSSTQTSLGDRSVVLLRDKDLLSKVPRAIPFWGMKRADGGQTIFCNVTPFAKTKTVKTGHLKDANSRLRDDRLETATLPVPTLYTFLETAFIQQNISENSGRQTKFLSSLAEIYSKLALNILERNYGIGSSPNEYYETKAAFVVFFCNCLMEKDLASSIKIAESLIPTHKVGSFSSQRLLEMFDSPLTLQQLIEILSNRHSRLQKLKYRLFVAYWINDYGESMTLAVEVPIYLIFNLSSLIHNANLNNEFRLAKMIDAGLLGRPFLELMRVI